MVLNLTPPLVVRQVGSGLLVAVLALVCALSVVDNKKNSSSFFPKDNLV